MTEVWDRPRQSQVVMDMSKKREASRPRVTTVPSRAEPGGCKCPTRRRWGLSRLLVINVAGARGRDFRDTVELGRVLR